MKFSDCLTDVKIKVAASVSAARNLPQPERKSYRAATLILSAQKVFDVLNSIGKQQTSQKFIKEIRNLAHLKNQTMANKFISSAALKRNPNRCEVGM